MNNPLLATNDGVTKTYERKIILRKVEYMDDTGGADMKAMRYNHVLRHELVHAIAFECGLDGSFGADETLVDWVAHIAPILERVYSRAVVDIIKESNTKE